MRKHIVCLLVILWTEIFSTTYQAHLSDAWYPSGAKALSDTIVRLQKRANLLYSAEVSLGSVSAVIVPHAAYSYSGSVAAAVYARAHGGISKVIILAPDHSGGTTGVAMPSFDLYQIPTATLSIDTEAIKILTGLDNFVINDAIFSKEHSLEVQLPLVAYFIKQAKIIPLIVGTISCQQAVSIAHSLQKIIDKNTLVVVSSDFIHAGKRFKFVPFNDNQQLRIRHLNSQAIKLIEQGKCLPFASFMQSSKATICGADPLKVLLALLEVGALGDVEPRFIAYDTSSKGDNDDWVSYIGMLFTNQKLTTLAITEQLTAQEKRNLYQQAHDILYHLFDKDLDKTLYDPIQSFGVTKPYGAFVTLKKKVNDENQLRGCIGRIFADEPLYKTVAQVTEDAAFHDSRFSPLIKDELPSIKLSISVLSRPRIIDTYKKISLGKDGIIMQKDSATALFLPEVPSEFNWNLTKTLEQLSIKAGLLADSWQDKHVIFKTFSTLEISE